MTAVRPSAVPVLSVLPERTVELATAVARWLEENTGEWVSIALDTLESALVVDLRDGGSAVLVTAWSDDQWNVTDFADLGGFEPYRSVDHALARAVEIAALGVTGRHP